MKSAIVTGANGFVGSHLVYQLLEQGFRVHALGRGTPAQPFRARIESAVAELGPIRDLPGSLDAHEIDLEAIEIPAGLLSPRDSPGSTTLFHIAGDTRFHPPDPALQRRINVDGTVNIVRALRGRIGRAVHISTTFVSGDRNGAILEGELDCGQGFRNAYEKSKFDAEIAVTQFCRTHDIPLVITRPSVVTNDRRTGRASTFTHLNALVEVVSRVQRFYKITDGQAVSPQIRLLADPTGSLNLAPVDSVVPLLLRVALSPDAPGRTFHISHPAPESNQELIGVMVEALRIRDKVALQFMTEILPPMTRTEELIRGALDPYVPYLNSRARFDMTNVRAVAPDYETYFSAVDPPYIRKVLDSQRAAKAARMAGRAV